MWKRFIIFFRWLFNIHDHHREVKISLIIPFSSHNILRKIAFEWMKKYWHFQLPEAEIIVGHSHSKVFCKGRAINNAVDKSKGRVLVILDADTYMNGKVVERCANRILEEHGHGHHLWYVPYRNLYRLNKEITAQILSSDPENALQIPHPPPAEYLDDNGHKSGYGHRYAAMIVIIPRKAFDLVGGCDERFKGWGGEDIAFLRCLDTLYGKHKTTDNDIFHLWHPFVGRNYQTRQWKGQTGGGANNRLASDYNRATGNPAEMWKLVHEANKRRRK